MTAEAIEASPRQGVTATGRDPLRIALLTYKGNPFCGGQGVYVRHLSRELVRLGHHVEVIGSQPYPVLDEGEDLAGLTLTEIASLDLYRSPDPFRTPKREEFRDWIDGLEVATMWTGGFPEPLTFSLRARRMLAARRGDFDVVHDNQTLGYGLLGGAVGGQLQFDQTAGGPHVVAVLGQGAVGAGRADFEDVLALAHRVGLVELLGDRAAQLGTGVQLHALVRVDDDAQQPTAAGPGHLDLFQIKVLRGDERLHESAQPVALGGAHPGDSSAACAVVVRRVFVACQTKGYPVPEGVAVHRPRARGYARLR